MTNLRCTARRLKRLGFRKPPDPGPGTNVLGDWTADLVAVPGDAADEERLGVSSQAYGPTRNRSVVGALTDFSRMLRLSWAHEPDLSVFDGSLQLAETPCGPLGMRRPRDVVPEILAAARRARPVSACPRGAERGPVTVGSSVNEGEVPGKASPHLGTEATARTRWGLVLLTVAAGVCGAFQVGKVPPAVTELQSSLGISLVTAGWVISVYSAVGALCGVAMGAAGDRFGYRRAVLFGLTCLGAGSLLGAVSPGPAWLLGSRVLEGLGFILVAVSAPALIFQLARPSDLGLAFGCWSCFMPLGTALMMLGAPALLSWFGWRGVWACNGLLLLSAAAVFHFALRALPGRRGVRAVDGGRLWGRVRLVVSRPGPVLLGVAWSMYTTTFMVVMGFLPTLLMEEGLTRLSASALTAAAVAVNMTGALGGGWLLKRGVPRWALMTFAGVFTGLCMLGVYAPGSPGTVRYLFCFAFSAIGGLQPTCVLGGAPLYAPAPTAVGTTNGFVNQCSYVGMVFGPPAAAALATASGGWQNTPWILTSAAAVWVACALALRKIPPTNVTGTASRPAPGSR